MHDDPVCDRRGVSVEGSHHRQTLKCSQSGSWHIQQRPAYARRPSADAKDEPIVREEAQHQVAGAGNSERAGEDGLEGKQSAHARLHSVALRLDASSEIAVQVSGDVKEGTRIYADS